MEKTIEEKKNAVAAYSNQHIPHYGDCMTIGKIEFTRSTVTKRNFAISFLDENGDSTTIWLAETIAATDARWQLFYSVLGLEVRDAVEATRLERRKEFMAEVDAKVAALEARNTALVAALGKVGKTDLSDSTKTWKHGALAMRKIANEALAANTEKGGANG